VNIAFPQHQGLAPERFDPFFKWVPSDEYLSQTADDDATLTALVEVDYDLIALHIEEVGTGVPVPDPGFYILHWNEDGVIHVFTYGEQGDAARQDIKPFVEDSLFGDEPYDEKDGQ